jgi:glyoxylase-like metal-dependent hydrolase (beta-lactamase superfamily II)
MPLSGPAATHPSAIPPRPQGFPGGAGNTQKDAARFSSLLTGVKAKLFGRLPDETWVYPGHGKDTPSESWPRCSTSKGVIGFLDSSQ